MVDKYKHACHRLVNKGYKNSQWPESYITWEFLNDHPRAMESRYVHIEWNNISGLYNWKFFLRTLLIEKREWDHLSNPAQLKCYWEPTQKSEDFHRMLALALCWTPFHNCKDAGRKKEYVMSVTIIQKPARHFGLLYGSCRRVLR